MNLSETEPLQVMLSSRASDKIMFEGKFQELSVLRRASKAQLESVKIAAVSFFQVWIHEDGAFQPATPQDKVSKGHYLALQKRVNVSSRVKHVDHNHVR
jgi:hypothetical protein